MSISNLINLFNDDSNLFAYSPKNTSIKGGIFASSPLDFLYSSIFKAITEGFVDPSKWLCDAGSGNGSVVAMTSSELNIPSLGIEFDKLLANYSKILISGLENFSNDSAPAIITQGDFLNLNTYSDIDIPFSRIGTFFNYYNNSLPLAKLFLKEADSNSILLIYSSSPSLKNVESLGLNRVRTYSEDSDCAFIPGSYLNLYRK